MNRRTKRLLRTSRQRDPRHAIKPYAIHPATYAAERNRYVLSDGRVITVIHNDKAADAWQSFVAKLKEFQAVLTGVWQSANEFPALDAFSAGSGFTPQELRLRLGLESEPQKYHYHAGRVQLPEETASETGTLVS